MGVELVGRLGGRPGRPGAVLRRPAQRVLARGPQDGRLLDTFDEWAAARTPTATSTRPSASRRRACPAVAAAARPAQRRDPHDRVGDRLPARLLAGSTCPCDARRASCATTAAWSTARACTRSGCRCCAGASPRSSTASRTTPEPSALGRGRPGRRTPRARTAGRRARRAAGESRHGAERAFGEAIEALFVDGTQPARVRGFADAMRVVPLAYPNDLDARRSPCSPRCSRPTWDLAAAERQAARDAAIDYAQRVFTANPNHPGGAHYLIHACDNPSSRRAAWRRRGATRRSRPRPSTRCTCPRTSSCSSGCGATPWRRTSGRGRRRRRKWRR